MSIERCTICDINEDTDLAIGEYTQDASCYICTDCSANIIHMDPCVFWIKYEGKIVNISADDGTVYEGFDIPNIETLSEVEMFQFCEKECHNRGWM